MKMKKISALLLAMGMTMSVGATALAAVFETEKGESDPITQDVAAIYEARNTATDSYYYTVTFTDLSFTYHEGKLENWRDQDKLAYKEPDKKGWVATSGNPGIAITNESNVDIKVVCKFVNDGTHTNVSGSFTESSPDGSVTIDNTHDGIATLKSALHESDPYEEGTAKKINFALALQGEPSEKQFTTGYVGTIKLEVSKVTG